MSVYRQVHVSFWQDSFVLDLTPEEKYFYVYLMTNSKTSQIGIYELPKRVLELETGYNRETVDKLLCRFVEYGKIMYNEETREIMLLNWAKHNWNNSPKVVKRVEKELAGVKHIPFVEVYLRTVDTIKVDTVSIQYTRAMDTKRTNKEKKKKKDNTPFDEVINYLNDVSGKNFRSTTTKTKEFIKARINEGFELEDFKRVVDIKCAEWLSDPVQNKFLRPETLFGNKFEGYLNQVQVSGNRKIIDWDNI